MQAHPLCAECLRRSPCGERGLKFALYPLLPDKMDVSLPVRGAWVEIVCAIPCAR